MVQRLVASHPKLKFPRALSQTDAVLPLNAQGGLRLAVVSDTHSLPHPRAAERIEALKPAAILHAGDIGNLNVLAELSELAPVVAVRGNIDARAPHLPDTVTVDLQASGQSVLKLLLIHIAVYGTKIRADAAHLATEADARLIVCGHSHVPFVGQDRGLTAFNPGSIGPRRNHLPIVFGVLEIADAKLSMRHIDCESGETWRP